MADAGLMEFLNRRHPAFKERAPVYKLMRQSYEGGLKWIEDNLFRFSPRESSADYERRKQQAVYPNLVKRTLGIYRDHVFKQGDALRRDVQHPAWEDFESDVDRNGASANEFWGELGIRAMLYGWMGVLVDAPRIPDLGRPMTMADVQAGVAEPYFVAVAPTEVADWSLDAFGGLNWVHLIQTEIQDAEPYTKRTQTTIHRVYDRQGWRIFDDKGNPIGEGTHGLGVVPFVVARIDPSELYAFIGTSFMEDYARINRAVANSISLRHDFLAKNALQVLTVQIQGMTDDDDGSEQLVIRNLLEYTGERPPQWVGPDVSGAEYMFRHAEDLLGWMRMMASLQDVDVETMAPQSGIAKLVDFEQTNAALSAFADAIEAADLSASQLWFRWQGIDWNPEWKIDYPDSFDVRSMASQIEEAHQVVGLYQPMSATLVTEYLTALADRVLDDASPETVALIEAEIAENAGNLVEESVFGGRVRRERMAGEEPPDEELAV